MRMLRVILVAQFGRTTAAKRVGPIGLDVARADAAATTTETLEDL